MVQKYHFRFFVVKIKGQQVKLKQVTVLWNLWKLANKQWEWLLKTISGVYLPMEFDFPNGKIKILRFCLLKNPLKIQSIEFMFNHKKQHAH